AASPCAWLTRTGWCHVRPASRLTAANTSVTPSFVRAPHTSVTNWPREAIDALALARPGTPTRTPIGLSAPTAPAETNMPPSRAASVNVRIVLIVRYPDQKLT